jgi:hypothetical protein
MIVAFSLATIGIADDEVEIGGKVIDPYGLSIPNAVVSFVAPNFRSDKNVTDDYGRFDVSLRVPQREDLLLEIYWNEEVIFRRPLNVLSFDYIESQGAPFPGFLEGYRTRLSYALQHGGYISLNPIRVGRLR